MTVVTEFTLDENGLPLGLDCRQLNYLAAKSIGIQVKWREKAQHWFSGANMWDPLHRVRFGSGDIELLLFKLKMRVEFTDDAIIAVARHGNHEESAKIPHGYYSNQYGFRAAVVMAAAKLGAGLP